MIKTSFLFLASVLTAGTVLAGTASPAIAAPPAAPTRIVSYADLDLASPAGRARLDQRLAAAARAVCGDAFATDLRTLAQVRACRAETLANAYAAAGLGSVEIVSAAPHAPAAGTR